MPKAQDLSSIHPTARANALKKFAMRKNEERAYKVGGTWNKATLNNGDLLSPQGRQLVTLRTRLERQPDQPAEAGRIGLGVYRELLRQGLSNAKAVVAKHLPDPTDIAGL